MNQNKKRRKRNNEQNKQKKVIRCNILNRPVFTYEICDKFSMKAKSNTANTCENCTHAF